MVEGLRMVQIRYGTVALEGCCAVCTAVPRIAAECASALQLTQQQCANWKGAELALRAHKTWILVRAVARSECVRSRARPSASALR